MTEKGKLMDKYAAIEKYETRISDLELKRYWILSTLEDRDVAKQSKSVFENVADIDKKIAIYVDFIETISNLEI